jgi:hypothetical protein
MLSTREGFRGEEHFEAIECQARNWVPCKVFTPDNSAQLGVARCALTIIHKATSLECRLGTFNAQRSTLNFQCGDRKGALWPGYGDRHGVLPVGGANRGTDTTFGPGAGLLTCWTCPSAGRTVEAGSAPRYGDRHDVRCTGQESST